MICDCEFDRALKSEHPEKVDEISYYGADVDTLMSLFAQTVRVQLIC